MGDESKAVVMSFSPSFHAAMHEQADFEAGMIQLASLLPYPAEKVSDAFRCWAGPNPLPWRVALDYCLDRVTLVASEAGEMIAKGYPAAWAFAEALDNEIILSGLS